MYAAKAEKYNGWANYETWNVALWLDNEQGSYNYWRDAAKGLRGRKIARIGELAIMLKVEITDQMPDMGASMWTDLLGAALSEVDWHEIASHILSES